jgi:hypothetical protein
MVASADRAAQRIFVPSQTPEHMYTHTIAVNSHKSVDIVNKFPPCSDCQRLTVPSRRLGHARRSQ